MWGIPDSVFNEIGSAVKGWLKNPLNQAFFFWYFFPAAGFVLLQLIAIGPALGFPAPSLLSGEFTLPPNTPDAERVAALILSVLGRNLFVLVLLPLLIGLILAALSGSILGLYQGSLPIVRRLLAGRLARYRRQSDELYGPLRRKRREYFFLVSNSLQLTQVDGQEHTVEVDREERDRRLAQLKQEIQAMHVHYEDNPADELPATSERVAPTRLGNVLAVAEEYPFDRYGIDAVVFWPRLRAELAPEQLEPLDTSFTVLNGLLNISLLAALFVIESLAVFIVGLLSRPAQWGLAIGSALGAVIAVGAYRGAVSSAQAVGDLLKTAFDYDRGRVLHRFNLRMPDDIEEERVLWLSLAAFVRRGESFYFPDQWRKVDKDK